jgi:hypothetical protein
VPDVGLHVLRNELLRQSALVAKGVVDAVRHFQNISTQFRDLMERVPTMPEAEVRRILPEMLKYRAMLNAVAGLGQGVFVQQQEAEEDAPATTAPGTERKQ